MEEFVHNQKPLAEQAAEYLIQWINENGIKPGDRIPPELELTKILNLGRSTVREAVAILKSRNIVEIRRGCGTYLCEDPGVAEDPLGLAFLEDKKKLAIDWGEIRMMIEPKIAEMAAIHATDEEIEQLRYWNEKIDELNARGEPHREVDTKFHRVLAIASHNLVAHKLVPIINEGITQFLSSTNNSQSPEIRYWHHEIVNGVATHDSKRAGEATVKLLQVNEKRLQEMYAGNEIS